MVSRRIPFMDIRRLKHGARLYGIRGQIINVPIDVQKTVQCLPRSVPDDAAIEVQLKRRLLTKPVYKSGLDDLLVQLLALAIVVTLVFLVLLIEVSYKWDYDPVHHFLIADTQLPVDQQGWVATVWYSQTERRLRLETAHLELGCRVGRGRLPPPHRLVDQNYGKNPEDTLGTLPLDADNSHQGSNPPPPRVLTSASSH
ncbi:hypothetical protein HPB49_002834 [Dermacentor silvarum]|uniref:Uncharacterized protein n=1 Tax=Dermacentor silvarum TaxID=543639 RepID=A0ACB8CPD8_DERSI|nr:hypothetical protein HPB49_002834 [Dermacentor silvarum]